MSEHGSAQSADEWLVGRANNKRSHKRKAMGRAARRRRAKLRAIQEAEERLWVSGETSVIPRLAPVPHDRHKVWPGVLERRKVEGWSDETDEAALVGQLGYLPGNAVAVVARAAHVPSLPVDANVPIVLKLYPLAVRDVYSGGKSDGRKFKGRRRGRQVEGEGDSETISFAVQDSSNSNGDESDNSQLLEPFPTLYWLTHPILRTLASKLELGTTDNCRVMEKRLLLDKEALHSMVKAHEAYGEGRWACLTTEDLKLVDQRKWHAALDFRLGVAGIKNHTTTKCLHAHLAHYLSGDPGSEHNVVGKWALQAICQLIEQAKSKQVEGHIETNEDSPFLGNC